eukprot:602643_1
MNLLDGCHVLFTFVHGLQGEKQSICFVQVSVSSLTIWDRIAHTIIPTTYKQEFVDVMKLFITDLAQEEVQLISNLAAVSLEDAQSKLDSNTGDVFQTLMDLIAEKEKLTKIEIKKQEQLKKERSEDHTTELKSRREISY